jgi:proline dehydrogenase
MYLQRSPKRLEADISRAKRFGYVFAAKLVRGAYMKFEFENAEKTGTAVPYWPSLAKTHDAYDGAVGLCLTELSQGLHAYLMLATHNQSSIEKAMSLMRELKMSSESVSFTQLYGMKDHITFALGTHGYRAYK